MSDVVYRSGYKAGIVSFKAMKSIIRPADTTTYTPSDLINASGATGLVAIDFGQEYANHVLEINFLAIMSSNGGVASKLDAAVYFFNNATVLGAGSTIQKDDNAPFIPTASEVNSKKEGPFETLPNSGNIGTTNYTIFASEKCIAIKLDSNGKIYAAIVANNAYTPANAEILTLVMKGYDLG